MTWKKPFAPAGLAVLAAGLLALSAGAAAQDAPDEEAAAPGPALAPGQAAGEAEEEVASEEEEEEEVEEEAPAAAAPPGPGPALGDEAQPPGTFPDPEPIVAPAPPEPEEGEEEGEEAAPEPEPEPGEEVSEIELDAAIPTAVKKRRFFQIQGLYELHFNLISDDYSANDWLSFWMLRANFDITKFDQLSLRMDLEQRYVADPGESGLWFGDIRVYYNRKFTIPIPGFPIPGKASVYLTAPTSRASQRRSYITKPTAVLALAPSLGPVSLVAYGYLRYNFVKYAESDHRGTPNTMLTTGFMFQVIYAPLDWFAPSAAWVSTWSKPYRTREVEYQPWKENYYWEVALNFSLPMPEKAPSIDLTLAYAQGANVLEEGVYRLYFAKRDQSELYLGLNMIY